MRPVGTNGFAIAALVCSLVSCGIGSVLGIVFGTMARNQIRQTGEQGEGMAKAGIIIGWVGIAGFVLYIVFIVVLVASGAWSSSGS